MYLDSKVHILHKLIVHELRCSPGPNQYINTYKNLSASLKDGYYFGKYKNHQLKQCNSKGEAYSAIGT
jgi:hypothetical protein